MKCSGSCRQFCRWIEGMPYHRKFTLMKEDYPTLPECFSETFLGEMVVGAERQLRGPSGAHVHEFLDRWEIHRDHVDADHDPLGHLLKDAPEYLISAAAMILTGMALGRNGGKGQKGGSLMAGGVVGVLALLTGKFLKMVDEGAGEEGPDLGQH